MNLAGSSIDFSVADSLGLMTRFSTFEIFLQAGMVLLGAVPFVLIRKMTGSKRTRAEGPNGPGRNG